MISTLEELEQVPVGTDVDVFNGEEWQTWVRSELGLVLDGVADLGLGRFSGTVGQEWVRLTSERPPEPGDYLRNRMYRDHYHALYVVGEFDADRMAVLVLTSGTVTGAGTANKDGLTSAAYEFSRGLPDDVAPPSWFDVAQHLATFYTERLAEQHRAVTRTQQIIHEWATDVHPAPGPSFDRALARAGMPRERAHVVTVNIAGTYRSDHLLAVDVEQNATVDWSRTVMIERTGVGHQGDAITREEVEAHVPDILREQDWGYAAECCAE